MSSARGTFCLSIDLELAWGNWDRLTPGDLKNCAELERPIAAAVLALFDRYDIPATWAVVGRLLEKTAGGPKLPGDESAWYAPDIIEKIKAAKTPQEIGSHGFAHIYYAECGAEAASADLAAAKRVHAAHGLPFSSFVFPRNQVAHLELLARSGG
jgi:peptidoglycan/xylan/chitin deacetylase (PgdA/CDA1 family)